MKLRIRSIVGKETFRVEAPTTSTVDQLKTLISAHISTPPPSSALLHLSLNRKDELVSSPDQSLQTLGLTPGDLVFYSLSLTTPQILSQPPIQRTEDVRPPPMSVDEASILVCDPPEESPDTQQNMSPNRLAPEDAPGDHGTPTLAPNPLNPKGAPDDTLTPVLDSTDGKPVDEMEVDEESNVKEKSFSIPRFLKKILEVEKGNVSSDLGLLMIAIHAVFLESGFVSLDSSGSLMTQGWVSTAPVLSISYTVPDLAGPNCIASVQTVRLKFMRIGNFADVYGSLTDGSDCYRLCLDLLRCVPSLVSPVDATSEKDEEEVFEFWKIVKDRLSLPLLIDICEKNGLPSPPCFMRLPTELKIKILELLPGVDVAKFGCVSSELRYLSSNNELWMQKFEEEFGRRDYSVQTRGRWNGKDKFEYLWVKKKKAMRRPVGHRSTCFHFRTGPIPFGSPAINIIGGDYDLYPAGIPINRNFSHFPARRNFVRHCNFGFNA